MSAESYSAPEVSYPSARWYGDWKLETSAGEGHRAVRKLTRYDESGVAVEWAWEDRDDTSGLLRFENLLDRLQRIHGKNGSMVRIASNEPARPTTTAKVEIFIRRPGVTEDVGPWVSKDDARLAAKLLNAYMPEDEKLGAHWEAYSVTTEETIL